MLFPAGAFLIAAFKSVSIWAYTVAFGDLVKVPESDAVNLESTNNGTSPKSLTSSK